MATSPEGAPERTQSRLPFRPLRHPSGVMSLTPCNPGAYALALLHIFSRKAGVSIDTDTIDRARLAAGHLPSSASEPIARLRGWAVRGLGHVRVAKAGDGGTMPTICATASLDGVRCSCLTPVWRHGSGLHGETCVEERGRQPPRLRIYGHHPTSGRTYVATVGALLGCDSASGG